MERCIGAVSRGVRAPIIREGDDIVQIVVDSVLKASKEHGIEFCDRDVVAVTESVVARAQGNYVSTRNIADDVMAKIPGGEFGIIFPILSRNRFAICLRGLVRGAKKVFLMLSYPSDEVGNHLISEDQMDAAGIDPYRDILSEHQWRANFGYEKHRFTGIDYIDYYKQIVREEGAEIEIIEKHHDRKVDAPSGTALSIAKAIQTVRENATIVTGRSGDNTKRTKEEIGICSVRMGNIVGEHEVLIGTPNQTISLKHEAHSRALFAEGAIQAAQFLVSQEAGLYTMDDLVSF